MPDLTPFETRLTELLEADSMAGIRPVDRYAIARSVIGGERRRSAGPFALRWPLMPGELRILLPLGLALVGLVVLGLAVAVVGSRLLTPPPLVIGPTGPLAVPRSDAAAAPLGDGRTLVIGGWSVHRQPAQPSSEIYDQRTGTFSSAGEMATSRSFATATLLPDGRVLVAGGHDRGRYVIAGWFPGTSSVELYDPEAGTFTSAAPLSEGRSGHTATLLPDGRLLVVGGYGMAPSPVSGDADPPGTLASAEIFDPATGRWHEVGPMAGGRYLHTAVPVTGGVLVVGGRWDWERAVSATRTSFGSGQAGPPELYDIATESFSRVSLPTGAEKVLVAAPLADGRALLIGARLDDSGDQVPWALALDPMSGAFEGIEPPEVGPVQERPVDRPVATILPDGRTLIVGLRAEGDGWSADVFDPTTGRFAPLEADPIPSGATVTPLEDGAVLIAGGMEPTAPVDTAVADARIWRPDRGS